MMATRKLFSVVTVLLMVGSGFSAMAFAAGPGPVSYADVVPITEDETIEAMVLDPAVTEAIEELKDSTFGPMVSPVSDPVDDDLLLERIPDGTVPESVPYLPLRDPAFSSKAQLQPEPAESRAPAKILLIDDDNSDHTNTTQAYNNSGMYQMDTAHIMAESLTRLSIDYDLHLVESGDYGPVYDKMNDYSTIIWMFGYEGGFYYYPAAQGAPLYMPDFYRIQSFMDAGGSMWFIGNNLLTSLYGMSNHTGTDAFTDASFAKKYLGISENRYWTSVPNPVKGDTASGNPVVTGSESYGTQDFFTQFDTRDDNTLCGIIRPKGGAYAVLRGDSVGWTGVRFTNEPVAVAYDSGTWRAATFCLDPAQIASNANRDDLVGKVMTWLGTPTLSFPAHSILNLETEVENQLFYWTDDHNRGGVWNFFYPGISSTVKADHEFEIVANIENHGSTNERNMNVRLNVYELQGDWSERPRELGNWTKQANVDAFKIATFTDKFTVRRGGFYIVSTNITLATDPRHEDDEYGVRIKAVPWADDYENGTSDWKLGGAWKETTNNQNPIQHSVGTTVKFELNPGTTTGDDLVGPTLDARFYNVSFIHPGNQYWQNTHVIWLNLLFMGRVLGQDSFDIQMKASNQTNWRSLIKLDSSVNNGDFSDGFYHFTFGLLLGHWYGQKIDFRIHAVKSGQFTNSWLEVDDWQYWLHEELNVPPWFLEKYPPEEDVFLDVGQSLDFKIFAEDMNGDPIVGYEWLENYVVRTDWTGNKTTFSTQLQDPNPDYQRGNTLNIAIKAFDDLAFNDTFWNVHLLDPRPRATDYFVGLEEIDEDVPTDIDMSTWFMDIEDQDWSVSSTGAENIKVTPVSGNDKALTLENKIPNWYGEDNITLTVKDIANSQANFTLRVIVNPVNDAPKWKPVNLPQGEQDEFYSFNLTATDVDNTFEELTFSEDAEFFDISDSGEIAFVPRNEHVGYNHFNVTVEDPDGLEDTMELTLFVVNVNDPPILRYIDTQTAREDEVFTLDVSEYVEDPDLLLPPEFRDRITYRDDTPKLDTNLETGLVTWDTPTNDDVGEFYFKITITDIKGRYAEQEIRIDVVNTNDPPKIGTISRQILHQDSQYTYNIPFEDDDLDVPGVEEELTFTNDHTDLFTIDHATGRISFTPENNQVGEWEVTITVTDLEGASDSKIVIFDVQNENDRPKLDYIGVQNAKEDELFQLTVTAEDPDLEDNLLGEKVDSDERLEFRTNSTTITIDRDTGEISYTPTNKDAMSGEIRVKITVIDQSSETDTLDVLFKIENVPDPPSEVQIRGILQAQEVWTHKKYALVATAEDIDTPTNELTYTWYAGETIIGTTQSFEWKPKGKNKAPLTVRLVVTDPDGEQTEASMNVTVRVEEEPGFPAFFALAGIAIVAAGMATLVSRRRKLG